MEVGGEGDYYTYRYTVTTRITPALRWAVMGAILMRKQHSRELISVGNSGLSCRVR